MPEWAIIVHGGAKDIAFPEEAAHRLGCERALACGQRILESGGPAVVAAEAAVRALEDDPTFNAGYGSVLNANGEVECDAAIMDGRTLDVGGVAALQGVRNPITVATSMLRDTPILLVGDGAHAYAQSHGAELCKPGDLISPGRTDSGCDTVGCVAFDREGNLAAATSTGGLAGCPPGRVGDSPIPGCGLYAENGVGGVSLSGEGERITRVTLAAFLMQALKDAPPGAAIAAALQRLAKVGGQAGLIVIDGQGRVGWGHNSSHFAVAWADSDTPVRAFTRREETPLGLP